MLPRSITILGAGAWGTAIASLLAKNGHRPLIWAFEPDVATTINELHSNRFLSGITLDPAIKATSDLVTACEHSSLLVEAIPVPFIRSTLNRAKSHITPEHRFIMTSKGIEVDTLVLPTEIVHSMFPEVAVAALGGPNFAFDVARGQFSATMIASKDQALLKDAAVLFASKLFLVTPSTDIVGVQVGGALKNVITLAIGIALALGFSENTVAYLITKGLAEMAALTLKLGGESSSMYGLPGVGDLVLTCLGSQSRNLRAGVLLGQGQSVEQLKNSFPTLPEGVNTLPSVVQLCQKHTLSAPLIQATHAVVAGRLLPKDFATVVLEA